MRRPEQKIHRHFEVVGHAAAAAAAVGLRVFLTLERSIVEKDVAEKRRGVGAGMIMKLT